MLLCIQEEFLTELCQDGNTWVSLSSSKSEFKPSLATLIFTSLILVSRVQGGNVMQLSILLFTSTDEHQKFSDLALDNGA